MKRVNMNLKEINLALNELLNIFDKNPYTNDGLFKLIRNTEDIIIDRKRQFEERILEISAEGKKIKDEVRLELIEEIKSKYYSHAYQSYFGGTNTDQHNIWTSRNLVLDIRTVERDFERFRAKEPPVGRPLEIKLDFYSCLLGFEGWRQAKYLNFDADQIPIQPFKKHSLNDKNTPIPLSLKANEPIGGFENTVSRILKEKFDKFEKHIQERDHSYALQLNQILEQMVQFNSKLDQALREPPYQKQKKEKVWRAFLPKKIRVFVRYLTGKEVYSPDAYLKIGGRWLKIGLTKENNRSKITAYKKAIVAFEKSLTGNDYDLFILKLIGWCWGLTSLLVKGNDNKKQVLERSILALERSLTGDMGRDALTFQLIGRHWIKIGVLSVSNREKHNAFKTAISILKQSLTGDKNDLLSFELIGWSWGSIGLMTNKNKEKIKIFHQVISSLEKSLTDNEDTDSSTVTFIGRHWIEIGVLSKKNEDKKNAYKKAIEAYEKSHENQPVNFKIISWCWGMIGLNTEKAEEKIQLFLKVIEALEKALTGGASDSFIFQMIARHWFEIGVLSKKDDDKEWPYKKAIEAHENSQKDDPATYYLIGGLWSMIELIVKHNNAKESACRKAIKAFEKSLVGNTADASVLEHLGNKWSNLAEYAPKNDEDSLRKAIVSYDNALKLNPDSATLKRSIGWSYLKLGEIDKSKNQYAKAISGEGSEYAHMNLGHCELCLNNETAAIKNYKLSLDIFNCSQEFFDGFDDDFRYLVPQGIAWEYYENIKEELLAYCDSK